MRRSRTGLIAISLAAALVALPACSQKSSSTSGKDSDKKVEVFSWWTGPGEQEEEPGREDPCCEATSGSPAGTAEHRRGQHRRDSRYRTGSTDHAIHLEHQQVEGESEEPGHRHALVKVRTIRPVRRGGGQPDGRYRSRGAPRQPPEG